ncbi:MAG: DUF294 nucleotidyltransferase-like domain-containing protein [Pseudomonadota bacterium]
MDHELLGQLARTAPFSGFSKSERGALAREIVLASYPDGAVILEQGHESHDHLYLVMAGQLRLIEAGPGGTTRTFGVGKMFGNYGLLRGGPLPYRAEALGEVTLGLIPAEVFHGLCDKHPRVLAFFESDIRAYTRHHVTLYDLSGAQFLFGTRLSDLIHRPAPCCGPELSVRDAAELMCRHSTDHLVVMAEGEVLGLLTDRDLRGKILAAGAPPESPVESVMSREIGLLTARNSLFEGLIEMATKGLSHLLVRARPDGPLLGVVRHKDIARSHGYSPMLLLEQIGRATALAQLAELRREADRHLLQLYRRGVRAQDLITINTLVNDQLTGRVIALSQAALAEGRPDGDFSWAWLSLGSEGRGEMSLKTDQDNALVYQAPEITLSEVERWVATWAARVNQDLDQVGLRLCQGGMMAGNPLWRHSLERWPRQFDDWLSGTTGHHVMQVAAACDLRAVHGACFLAEPVKRALVEALLNHPRFLRHLAQGVIRNRSPVDGLFGRIRAVKTESGRAIDIKRRGLQPITDFARILALRHRYLDSSNTFDRLEHLRQVEPKLEAPLQDALEAYRHLNDIRLGQHLHDASTGVAPTNWISLDKLGATQREMLKAAFGAIDSIQAVLAQRY